MSKILPPVTRVDGQWSWVADWSQMKNKKFEKVVSEWIAERDAALGTLDLEKFKEFYLKWNDKGVYQIPLPDDTVAEILMYKCACNCTSLPVATRLKATRWLLSHGYDPKIN